MSMDPTNIGQPRAVTYTVEELIADARRGRVRVPQFQRPLRWAAQDVVALFDSIHHGYPIGSLLLWRRPGPAPPGPVRLGPLVVDNPERDDVRWVVDGQQRITALVAGLSGDRPSDPTFDVWFDPDARSFHARPRGGPEPIWVAVPELLDAASLGEFLLDWRPGLDVRERRRTVLEAGKRLRQYPLLATVLEAADDRPLREVFRRINRRGRQLDETDVFDALVSSTEQPRLSDMGAGIAGWGWGQVDESVLLWSVLAILGLDPTRKLERQPEGTETRVGAVAAHLLTVFSAVVAFLRDDAAIPHLRALPHARHVLVTLARWFALFPDTSARSRRLLTRWVWRNAVSGRHAADYVFLRAAVAAVVVDDEDGSISRLLALVPGEARPWTLPRSNFRSNANEHRVGLLGIAALGPRDLNSADELQATTLLDEQPPKLQALGWGGVGLADRALYPGPGVGALLEAEARRNPDGSVLLASHALDAVAARALNAGDLPSAASRRGELLERVVNELVAVRAEWGHHDGPSVRTLFRSVG